MSEYAQRCIFDGCCSYCRGTCLIYPVLVASPHGVRDSPVNAFASWTACPFPPLPRGGFAHLSISIVHCSTACMPTSSRPYSRMKPRTLRGEIRCASQVCVFWRNCSSGYLRCVALPMMRPTRWRYEPTTTPRRRRRSLRLEGIRRADHSCSHRPSSRLPVRTDSMASVHLTPTQSGQSDFTVRIFLSGACGGWPAKKFRSART